MFYLSFGLRRSGSRRSKLGPGAVFVLLVAGILLAGVGLTARVDAQSLSDTIISQAGSPAPQADATAAPAETPLYDVAGDIYTIDRDATLYYYFRGNTNGSLKAKYEFRFNRNLWNDNAQIRLRVPFVTMFPTVGATFSGMSNIELGYSYGVTSKTLDHYLEMRVSLPTAVNGSTSNDTQLKGFYNLKWRFNGWNIAYSNEFDQTIIKPPGSSWTSYYEGKLTTPGVTLVKGVSISGIYNYRFVFDSGGIFKDVAGGTIYGNIKNVALSITDSWQLGANALWRYNFEANATARL
jgi:hypothetical protein